MPGFEEEVKHNFESFTAGWKHELSTIQASLDTSEREFLNSYKRLTSINSWRELLIRNEVSEESCRFFSEAQNDGVSSHVLARLGSWRAALKCLRSCMENVVFCEYYRDHPIELRLWAKGKHRLGFSEAISYFQKHPDLERVPDELTGLGRMQKEYSVLSRAVHASAHNLRMTVRDGNTNLWSSESAKLAMWITRETQTIIAVNLLLLALHSKSLQGTSLPGLRKAIAVTITSANLRNKIRSKFSVNLDI
jgi:hypothetical protein